MTPMAGAGSDTRKVTVLNGNWHAGAPGTDGAFAFMLVTDDDERHIIETSPAAATALLAIAATGATLLWDPEARALIAAGIVGDWLD